MTSQLLQPCGTASAYTRHLKHKETPCPPCKEANSRYRQDIKAKQAADKAPAIPAITVDGTSITITASADDARAIAAAILDRALAAEQQEGIAGANAQAARLRLIHKKLASTVRQVEA